jgi:hypothetical protein
MFALMMLATASKRSAEKLPQRFNRRSEKLNSLGGQSSINLMPYTKV